MPRRPRDERLVRAFGDRLRQARLEAGLTQEQLAERAGMHYTYTGYLERGKATPSLDAIVCLAWALGIDPGRLVEGLTPTLPTGTE